VAKSYVPLRFVQHLRYSSQWRLRSNLLCRYQAHLLASACIRFRSCKRHPSTYWPCFKKLTHFSLRQHVESLELLFSESEQALASCTPGHLQVQRNLRTDRRLSIILISLNPVLSRKKCQSYASSAGACGRAWWRTAATLSSSRSRRLQPRQQRRTRPCASPAVLRRRGLRRCRACKSALD
jgi:hypothetical protein